VLRFPWRLPRNSAERHFAYLFRGFGGWYPARGQLERCANGYFDLIAEVDGTDDYRRTSEHWLATVRGSLVSWTGLKAIGKSLPVLARQPGQYLMLIWALLASESWNWQFRLPAPTRLLRQTWAYRD